MAHERQRIGSRAEQLVAVRLRSAGWKVLERNARTRHGELDIVALDGTAVAHASDLQAALDPEKVGNAIAVKVLRGGKLHDVKLTVGERSGRE